MTDKSNDAAQRSAHVTRDDAAPQTIPTVHEWREGGKLVACAMGVHQLRQQLDELQAERVIATKAFDRLRAERNALGERNAKLHTSLLQVIGCLEWAAGKARTTKQAAKAFEAVRVHRAIAQDLTP